MFRSFISFRPLNNFLFSIALVITLLLPLTALSAKINKLDYQVHFEFFSSIMSKSQQEQTQNLLLKISEAQRLIDKPGTSLLVIKSRARKDLALFKQALNSRGYYDANVEFNLDNSPGFLDINYQIHSGQIYKVGHIQLFIRKKDANENFINLLDAKPELFNHKDIQKLLHTLQFKPADARKVIAFEEKIIETLNHLSHAEAKLIKKDYRLDKKSKSLNIRYYLDLGASIKLKNANFNGVKTVDNEYIESKIAWEPGQLYHPDHLHNTYKNLLETNLFNKVTVSLQDDELEHRHIDIKLEEKKHRTIKASIGFDTDDGISLGGSWQHRNFFGSGEKLTIDGLWYTDGIVIDNKYSEQSRFFGYNFETLAELILDDEQTDAYTSEALSSSLALKYQFNKHLSFSGGIGYLASNIQAIDIDNNSSTDENFSFIFSPWQLQWKTSNDLFEPSSGGQLFVRLSPYQSTKDATQFIQWISSYSHYFSFFERKIKDKKQESSIVKHPLILAMKLKLSHLFNCELNNIPADLRFYAGGGGSIRGYSRQLVGPLASDNTPIGGCSALDFAIETRFKITSTLGFVAFIDGGSAFEELWLDSSSEILLGGGLGVRYSTPIGPLRFDIGVPLDSRDNIDDSFQFYLSIGHAF